MAIRSKPIASLYLSRYSARAVNGASRHEISEQQNQADHALKIFLETAVCHDRIRFYEHTHAEHTRRRKLSFKRNDALDNKPPSPAKAKQPRTDAINLFDVSRKFA